MPKFNLSKELRSKIVFENEKDLLRHMTMKKKVMVNTNKKLDNQRKSIKYSNTQTNKVKLILEHEEEGSENSVKKSNMNDEDKIMCDVDKEVLLSTNKMNGPRKSSNEEEILL